MKTAHYFLIESDGTRHDLILDGDLIATFHTREAAEAEPGFAPLAGPADISARNMGGEGGAQRHGCRRRLPRLIEVR